MAVRWFILAFGLCWLGPVAPRATKDELALRRTDQQATPAAPSIELPVYPARNLVVSVRGVPMRRIPPVARYRAVLRCLFGPRFLFRNQKRLTPYGDVLVGGVRQPGEAPQTIGASRSKHQQ
jgi:hypothetical protein